MLTEESIGVFSDETQQDMMILVSSSHKETFYFKANPTNRSIILIEDITMNEIEYSEFNNNFFNKIGVSYPESEGVFFSEEKSNSGILLYRFYKKLNFSLNDVSLICINNEKDRLFIKNSSLPQFEKPNGGSENILQIKSVYTMSRVDVSNFSFIFNKKKFFVSDCIKEFENYDDIPPKEKLCFKIKK